VHAGSGVLPYCRLLLQRCMYSKMFVFKSLFSSFHTLRTVRALLSSLFSFHLLRCICIAAAAAAAAAVSSAATKLLGACSSTRKHMTWFLSPTCTYAPDLPLLWCGPHGLYLTWCHNCTWHPRIPARLQTRKNENRGTNCDKRKASDSNTHENKQRGVLAPPK
jgi:hypothetical protein